MRHGLAGKLRLDDCETWTPLIVVTDPRDGSLEVSSVIQQNWNGCSQNILKDLLLLKSPIFVTCEDEWEVLTVPCFCIVFFYGLAVFCRGGGRGKSRLESVNRL